MSLPMVCGRTVKARVLVLGARESFLAIWPASLDWEIGLRPAPELPGTPL